MNTQTANRYRNAFDSIAAPATHLASRRQALERFLANGLPTPREEDWKYTSLTALEQAEWHVPGPAPETAVTEDYPGTLLRFGNGRLVDADPHAVQAHSLAAHADAAPAARYLGQLAGRISSGTALAQINSALWQDGLFLHVPARRTLPPLFVAYSASEADVMLHVRNLVVLEAGAEAVLVEHYRGSPGLPYWNNPVSEIVLGEGARLVHLKLTEESATATHTGLAVVQQARDSRYHALSISLGGRLARHDTWVSLDEPGAECQLDGLFIADARRHIDQHLHVEHAAPHTASRQTWRGIAAGRGRGIFDARVVVQPGAQKTDAQQSSRNLLLSPHAEIDVKPQLEIYADDVKCAHGATVGQLDEAQLFFLRSRGIAADAARALLLRGFVAEALTLAERSGLAGWLEPHLAAALPLPEKEDTA
ncbi:Fe-S cluster assembly protein SufD [Thiobacillus denitrificans]|uniref:Fe-S cluster assembly protein SufD n=1 Tax=Thiobacillus denitrificans TaxID=36861 RepID=UPI000363A743|nr:Fe-S cluster assembly protein SufD [Thiobacillus denitrificans]